MTLACPVVSLVWIALVIAMYPLCPWFAAVKRAAATGGSATCEGAQRSWLACSEPASLSPVQAAAHNVTNSMTARSRAATMELAGRAERVRCGAG